MALPKIDAPTYELELPLSKKKIQFRPFLVKEQKNLMMAMESDDKETIERNIRQVLNNCTITENIDIDKLPVIDIEYYFINLRARSVGEIVENKYVCTNEVNDKQCGNRMETSFNLLDIKVEFSENNKEIIQITDKISIKMKYPEFSLVQKLKNKESAVDVAFEVMMDSVEWIFDGEQYYHAYETSREELLQFIESLNQEQFSKMEQFFENLPRMNKKIEIKCSSCGFHHSINMEGLESFFG
jgi:T4 bacteriophage base plate protein